MLTMARTIRQFWNDLHRLISAGLPLPKSLDLILSSLDCSNSFAKELGLIESYVHCRGFFYEALLKNPKFFGPLEINLIKAGERRKTLEIVLGCLAEGPLPIKANEYQNFYFSLATCLRSGVPLLSALQIAKNYCSGDLAKAIDKLGEAVKNGNPLSEPMRESGLFCDNEIVLVELGEGTGALDGISLSFAKGWKLLM